MWSEMFIIRIGKSTRVSYWLLPLGLLFLVGGTLQYFSLLSPTQTNLLVLAAFSPVFLLRSTFREMRYEAPLLLLAAWALVVGLSNSTNPTYIATYVYYVLCTVVGAVAGRTACNLAIARSGIQKLQHLFISLSKAFLLLQVFVCILQTVFVDWLMAHAPMLIIREDAVSGTMFLKSDASLSAISELLIVAVFLFSTNLKDRLLVTALGIVVIYLGGSKAAQGTVLVILTLVVIRHLYIKLGLSRTGIAYAAIAALILGGLIFHQAISTILTDFAAYTARLYEARHAWVSAARLAPIGQIFVEGINLVGNGPLTYYNPITKTWLYDAGFSTFYSLYIDVGLVGLLLYFAYYVHLLWRHTRRLYLALIFLIVVMSFSAFNLTLSDLAFVFVLNFVVSLHFNRERLASKLGGTTR